MRKVFILLLTVFLIFNTIVFADESVNNGEENILAAFSVDPEFASDSITIKLSEMSRGSSLSFSYNPDTEFIYAVDGKYRISIKVLDDNIEVNETAFVLNNIKGMDMSIPYRFKAFIYIGRQDAAKDSYKSVLDPQVFFSGKEVVAVLAEATMEVIDGTAHFVVRKSGTSIHAINKKNVDSNLDNTMLLVNKNNTLDQSYFPPGLIYSNPLRGRTTVNLRLNKEAMKQLNYMLDSAYRDGVSGMVITSAFRTFDKQTSLFNNKTSILSRKMNRKSAMEEASKVVAIPGSSEHQTGLAADICSERVGLVSNFANTKQGKWLEDNSWKYGFVVRYPEDKSKITGIIYEPWHVRYVGSVHSEIMKANNMCLEEYVEYLKKNKVISFSDSSGSNYSVQYINKQDFNAVGVTLSLPETSTWNISNCTKDSYVLTIKL
ncbi:MAG TPA: M15 family metallopeptidase [Clostridia bacterium]|nr:M15 family metallopeptidase [Clostridia bacterium]